MSKISSKETKPEIIVRKHLFSKGYRYRKNIKSLPGTPDIVLSKYRTVVFGMVIIARLENFLKQGSEIRRIVKN